MKFKYTALGASNQKLEGVLDAESLEAAREELHKMGMSVVAINEVTAENAATVEGKESVSTGTQAGIVTYYFLAKDPQGKEVNGTIDSKDANSAYRRLFTEYQFDVLDLYPQGSVDTNAASLKPEFEAWKEQMQDEGIDFAKKSTAGTKGELEEGEKVDEEIIAEMDSFIINTKKILSDHRNQYSNAFADEIEKTLNELERIRASNNIKHITKICNNLYELISNADAMQEGENAVYQGVMSKLKGSGFITNRFQFLELHNLQKKVARFEKVQTILAKIHKVFNRKKASEIDKNLISKIKGRRAHWLSKITRGLKTKRDDSHPGFLSVVSIFFSYVGAPSAIMRHARKQELSKVFVKWKKTRNEPKKKVLTQSAAAKEGLPVETPTTEVDREKPDFSGFFMELDSFVGWLLFFYISYFFLVSFAIERNMGLPTEYVLRTLSSPLLINISIFLVVAHLAFTLKIRLFRSNFIGSLFLLFLCFGIYTLVIVNL